MTTEAIASLSILLICWIVLIFIDAAVSGLLYYILGISFRKAFHQNIVPGKVLRIRGIVIDFVNVFEKVLVHDLKRSLTLCAKTGCYGELLR